VLGRQSPKSLYSLAHVTFEADAVYDQHDAGGFIRLNALRWRLAARHAPHRDPLPASGERGDPLQFG
jgi:argininosuccinate synthase